MNNLPQNKYSEETERKILDAALKLFIEKGYEQTTILDIVYEMGGLTRGEFYHYFKSKEEVLFEDMAASRKVLLFPMSQSYTVYFNKQVKLVFLL